MLPWWLVGRHLHRRVAHHEPSTVLLLETFRVKWNKVAPSKHVYLGHKFKCLEQGKHVVRGETARTIDSQRRKVGVEFCLQHSQPDFPSRSSRHQRSSGSRMLVFTTQGVVRITCMLVVLRPKVACGCSPVHSSGSVVKRDVRNPLSTDFLHRAATRRQQLYPLPPRTFSVPALHVAKEQAVATMMTPETHACCSAPRLPQLLLLLLLPLPPPLHGSVGWERPAVAETQSPRLGPH